jgi:hypothetical protein
VAEMTQDQEREILAFRERMDAAEGGGDSLTDNQILWLISQIERPLRLEPGLVIDLEFPGDGSGFGGNSSYPRKFVVGRPTFRTEFADRQNHGNVFPGLPNFMVSVEFHFAPFRPGQREIPEVHRLSTRNERQDLANIADASLRGSRMEPRRIEELIRAIRECRPSELDSMRRRVRSLHRFYLRRELDEPEA